MDNYERAKMKVENSNQKTLLTCNEYTNFKIIRIHFSREREILIRQL